MRKLCALLLLPLSLFAKQASHYDRLAVSIVDSEGQQNHVDELVITHARQQRKAAWNKKAERQSGAPLGYPRDYAGGYTEEEFNDIQFIVRTLADKSLVTIAKERYSLEAAGDRIDHVHPLNFLLAIFEDEQLKVAVRNIRGKGWVWSNFMSGIRQTLSTEMDINNITPHLKDFAEKLEVGMQLLLPPVRSRNWDLLVEQLIKNVPRKNDGGRYDI